MVPPASEGVSGGGLVQYAVTIFCSVHVLIVYVPVRKALECVLSMYVYSFQWRIQGEIQGSKGTPPFAQNVRIDFLQSTVFYIFYLFY